VRERKVTRYYCDHCSMSKGTRPAMVRHERGCTLNPDRACGLCDMADQVNELPRMLALFEGFTEEVDFSSNELLDAHKRDKAARIATLRELAGGCPGCILAVLRQRKVYDDAFDWKAQSAKWLADHPRDDEAYYRSACL